MFNEEPKITEERRKELEDAFPDMYFDEYGYNRFNEPMVSRRVFPLELRECPAVVRSDENVAIIAINPKRGYILHRDGAKTEPSDLENLVFSSNYSNLPFCSYAWAVLAIGKKPEPRNWESKEEYNERIKAIKKELTWLK
jgi:hypothetical protein